MDFLTNQVLSPQKTFIPVLILLGVIKRKRWTNSTEVSPLTTRKLRYATGLLPHPPKHERRHAV